MPLTITARRLRAQLANAALQSQRDMKEQTRAATAATWERYLDQVDPDRTLPEDERFRRAKQAERAHMLSLRYRQEVQRQERTSLSRAERGNAK